ncbi:P-loop containing nucleoside triphosphate hydrolase protein [Hypoxylon sp. NC1633]|nr:P-loop containing nucleoside triphosphate hydrolase protein [Hypoxylon sp. NC1633]
MDDLPVNRDTYTGNDLSIYKRAYAAIGDSDDDEPVSDAQRMKYGVKNVYGIPIGDGKFDWVDEYPADVKVTSATDEKRHALVIRNKRVHGKTEIHEIVVYSPQIRVFLHDNIKYTPNLNFNLHKMVLKAPFYEIFHHWTELRQNALDQLKDPAISHIRLFLGIMRKELKEITHDHKLLVGMGFITYELLWTLFKPDDLVFQPHESNPRMYHLERTSDITYDPHHVSVKCSFIDWNGQKFRRRSTSLTISEFRGPKRITDLPIYPWHIERNCHEVEDKLLSRGKKFFSLAGTHHKAYRGMARRSGHIAGGTGKHLVHIDGRVVVDAEAYFQYNSRYEQDCEKPDDWEGEYFESLSGEQLVLCTPSVRGYSLIHKLWVKLDVDLLSDIVWEKDSFSRLQLPRKRKELILAFAETQLSQQDNFADIVEGKVVLLAGDTGLGKTFTTEAVAEHMRVPLYQVTVGELGSDIKESVQSLRKIVDLAKKWNAVLVLDDADVFIECSSTNELEKTQLVTSFLRILDCCQGLLFLTTTGVITDSAVKSYIHLHVDYPILNESSQKEIWRNFIADLPGTTAYFAKADYDSFSDFYLNGRQIKNALKLAYLLAICRKKTLAPSHVMEVLVELYAGYKDDDE